MPTAPGKSRKKPEIPVLWIEGCRSLPSCIATMDGIRQMARKKGYALRLCGTAAQAIDNPGPNRTVIVVGFEASYVSRDLQALEAAGLRVVVTNIDADHIDSHYSCATFSRRVATEQMLDDLLQKGCRHFAMLGCGDLSVNDLVHVDAMGKYLARLGGEAEGEAFYYHSAIAESFLPFTERREAFDAALCPNDYAAVAFLRFCESANIRVPEQLLLATLKGNFISGCCSPSITSYTVDFFAIGENTVMVWLYLQELGDGPQQIRITLPGKIVERESTRRSGAEDAPVAPQWRLAGGFQGGPFYREPTLNALMTIDRCLQNADGLDLRIVECLLGDMSYERIAETLYLSDSALQYRIRNLFAAVRVNARGAFVELFRENFTRAYRFQQAEAVPPGNDQIG